MTHTALAVLVAAPRVDMSITCQCEHVTPPRSDRRHILPAQRCYVFWCSVVVGCLIAGAESAEFTFAPSEDLTLICRGINTDVTNA